jgi:hypothetical protein
MFHHTFKRFASTISSGIPFASHLASQGAGPMQM